MRLRLTILFISACCAHALAQDTIWVKEGNKRYMHREDRSWTFNNHLKDGHYYSYESKDDLHKHPSSEVSIVNGLKNGEERRYYYRDTLRYVDINWKEGVKHGTETGYHADGKGTVNYTVQYKNGIVDGPFVFYQANGKTAYSGYVRNGKKDGIWTYYYEDSQLKDTARILSQYKYQNGRMLLLNSWDKKQRQTISNGNSIIIDTSDEYYLNGLLCGRRIFDQREHPHYLRIGNDNLYDEEVLKDGKLIKLVSINHNGDKSISEWTYPNPTSSSRLWGASLDVYSYIPIEEYINNDMPERNGHWQMIFANGTVAYNGCYKDGTRYGQWIWHYKNGHMRVSANYANNEWHHYDSSGHEVNNTLHDEYLTLLANHFWFVNGSMNKNKVVLSARPMLMVTPKLVFSFDDTFQQIDYLECGKDIGYDEMTWHIVADKLTLNYKTKKGIKTFHFTIVSGTNEEIVLERAR